MCCHMLQDAIKSNLAALGRRAPRARAARFPTLWRSCSLISQFVEDSLFVISCCVLIFDPRHVLSVDMGGTTAKVCTVVRGRRPSAPRVCVCNCTYIVYVCNIINLIITTIIMMIIMVIMINRFACLSLCLPTCLRTNPYTHTSTHRRFTGSEGNGQKRREGERERDRERER